MDAEEFKCNERIVYICSECGMAFETNTGIIEHMTTTHKDVKTIRNLLETRTKLKKPGKVKVRKRCSIFHCGQCRYNTPYRTTYDRHIMKHKQEYKACPHCRYKSIQIHNVRLHIQKQHASVVARTDLQIAADY